MLYALCVFVLIADMTVARTPIRHWLVAMPDSVMPLLTKNNRLDFVDFLDCGMEAVVTNRLDGKSQMRTLTEDYLFMNYTGVSEVEMKLFPVSDTTDVLCMVTTMKVGVCDSRVDFFDEAWHPLDVTDFFDAPQSEAFRTAERNDSADAAWAKMDVYLKRYILSSGENVLACRLTTLDYLNLEDRKKVSPYLKTEEIVYRWEDGRFVEHSSSSF